MCCIYIYIYGFRLARKHIHARAKLNVWTMCQNKQQSHHSETFLIYVDVLGEQNITTQKLAQKRDTDTDTFDIWYFDLFERGFKSVLIVEC